MGIAEENSYCGLIGSGRRAEFAVMGKGVVLAARLMAACKEIIGCGGILMDGISANCYEGEQYSSSGKLGCLFLAERRSFKGILDLVDVFCPSTELIGPRRSSWTRERLEKKSSLLFNVYRQNQEQQQWIVEKNEASKNNDFALIEINNSSKIVFDQKIFSLKRINSLRGLNLVIIKVGTRSIFSYILN